MSVSFIAIIVHLDHNKEAALKHHSTIKKPEVKGAHPVLRLQQTCGVAAFWRLSAGYLLCFPEEK